MYFYIIFVVQTMKQNTLILKTMKATKTIGKFVALGSALMATVCTIASVVISPALMVVAAMFVFVMFCSK